MEYDLFNPEHKFYLGISAEIGGLQARYQTLKSITLTALNGLPLLVDCLMAALTTRKKDGALIRKNKKNKTGRKPLPKRRKHRSDCFYAGDELG